MLLVDMDEAKHWAKTSRRGDDLVYHIGSLIDDRLGNGDLDRVARFIYSLADGYNRKRGFRMGKDFILFQRRAGPATYIYTIRRRTGNG
jgi:hypothetical protein